MSQAQGPQGANGHSNLIKSYDTAQLQQQRVNANLSVGGSQLGNYNTSVPKGGVSRDAQKEGSLNRRGGGNTSATVQ